MCLIAALGLLVLPAGALGQAKPDTNPAPAVQEPEGYVIGPEDVLTITVYGQDPLLSGDVVVRSDGKISRRLIGEVQAAKLTPVELSAALTKAYAKFFEEPEILVQAKQINSRKVGITGNVLKPGEYPLNEDMNIVGLIIKAGGLQEYADKKNIRILRPLPNGKTDVIPFNYNTISEAKGPLDIPKLKPGDQVVVR
jgi:polysaccharide export outer membrane protein